MTSVFYHLESNTWSHNDMNRTNVTLGHNRLFINHISIQDQGKNTLTFQVKNNQQHFGPIIGILTNEDRFPFSGNIRTFKRICKKVMYEGGIPVIFTPSAFSGTSLKCYTFCFQTKKWIELFSPLPDVIYNRIPSVQYESNEQYKNFRKQLSELNIPFFNESYLSKIGTMTILSTDPFLSKYIPETIDLKTEEDLRLYLNKWNCIYIKKHHSAKGLGVFKISLLTNNTVSIRNAFHVELNKEIHECWKFISSFHEPYICQQGIDCKLSDGRKFDLRVLVHKKQKQYIISGIGVRVGTLGGITTHVPRGGSIISLEELPIQLNEQLLQRIVQLTGEELNKHQGHFYEFSMDIGLKDGHYYIFEINSKPMVFDEVEIKEKGLENLIHLFYELSNFEP
jgi:YheC/D like ATP-grasp